MPALLLRIGAPLAAALLAVPGVAQSQPPISVTYHAGWNLVGGPPGTTLSGMQGDLWTLAPDGSGYVRAPSSAPLTAGAGYWALFLTDTQISLPSALMPAPPISLPAGVWSIAGNPTSQPVALSGADVAYGFDPISGYTLLTVLPPGRAALVYSAAGGTLTLAPASGGPDTITSLTPPGSSLSPPSTPAQAGTAAETEGGVVVLASGVGQSKPGGPATVAALVRNDGPNVDGSPVTITVYDAGGAVLAAADTTLHYLPNGTTTGFAHRLAIHTSGVAASAQIAVGKGKPAGAPQAGALSVSQTAINAGRSGLQASALLTSTYTTDLTEVRVDAIAYDSGGAIVGGGETVKRLVPAAGATGVVVNLDVSTTPTRVDLYANLP